MKEKKKRTHPTPTELDKLLYGDRPIASYDNSPLKRFDDAVATVTTERGNSYGHPVIDFDRVARIKAVIADCPDPKMRHVLEMCAVKICRLIESPNHLDSWIDLAGYSRTAVMIMQREEGFPDHPFNIIPTTKDNCD